MKEIFLLFDWVDELYEFLMVWFSQDVDDIANGLNWLLPDVTYYLLLFLTLIEEEVFEFVEDPYSALVTSAHLLYLLWI